MTGEKLSFIGQFFHAVGGEGMEWDKGTERGKSYLSPLQVSLYKRTCKSAKVTGCLSVCVFVPKDLANR